MNQKEPTDLNLDIRRFSKHVVKVGPQRAFLDFVYGMFIVADEIMKTGANGRSYAKPPIREKGKVKPCD